MLWMAAIYMLSDRTGNELGSMLPWFQKLLPGMQSFDWGHFVAYFGLAWTYLYGFGRHGDRGSVKAAVVFLCLLYGLTDEYHQRFVEGRTADWRDLRNDTIGAAAAMLLAATPAVRRWYRVRILNMR